MLIDYIYCIDYIEYHPDGRGLQKLLGWMLSTTQISSIEVIGAGTETVAFTYGLSRADVSVHFGELPGSSNCGFRLEAGPHILPEQGKLRISVVLLMNDGTLRQETLDLELVSGKIMQAESQEQQALHEERIRDTEIAYQTTLNQHPWITLRMDISNKCNLRCIMCHYREKEIYSRPARFITAEELKAQIHDMAPFIRHIMLSCGFEPLVSKHFSAITEMLHRDYPHMEIGLCTNAMLLDSAARKAIMENGVTHLLLSLDGVTAATVERIRVGADFRKIVSNIMAVRDLKKVHKRNQPHLFMDFVLMDSNIHEAPQFTELCAELGIELIDFRHLVGNVYFSEHEEMLQNKPEKYAFYHDRILEAAERNGIRIRLPEIPAGTVPGHPAGITSPDEGEYRHIRPDLQVLPVKRCRDKELQTIHDGHFGMLSEAACLRPFNEIMIADHEKVMPCSYYSDEMGRLSSNTRLEDIWKGKTFAQVRRRMLLHSWDHNCRTCPVRQKLLPES